MKKNRKLIVIISIIIIISLFFWRYINQYLLKSRATSAKVYINNENPTLINVAKNQEFSLKFSFKTSNQEKISAMLLNIAYDRDKDNNIDYLSFNQIPLGYFEVISENTIPNVQGLKLLQLKLVANKPSSQLLDNIVLSFKFKAKDKDIFSSIGIVGAQIVGTTDNYQFETSTPDFVTIAVGEAYLSPTPTKTPTPTPTEILTPNPSGSESVSLDLKIKFQGVSKEPTKKTLPVKIVVKKGLETVAEKTVDFNHELNANGVSIWTAKPTFNLVPGGDYSLLIKGPMHIQKKICDSKPVEAVGAEGTYRCLDKRLTINQGNNSFDFSGILLLVGDLPKQDGVVNSYDIGLIRNNLGKTDQEALELADVNYDGRVNSQDYGLVMFALSVRVDEE